MFEDSYDISSINSYLSSYHRLARAHKHSIKDKLELPSLNSHLFIKANLNITQLKVHVVQRQNVLTMPIFTFNVWHKLKVEIRSFLKKMFQQRFKEINQGNIITLQPGESINVRADCFCLSPHAVYTVLVPLEKCDINSAAIAVSQPEMSWKAENQEELFQSLQTQEFSWYYTNLEEGDLILIGRDCIYGSFRYGDYYFSNDGKEVKHFVEIRWVKPDQSSSSSNSS